MSKSYLNLEVAYNFAVEKLNQKDPVEIARNAGVEYNAEAKSFTVPYLGEKFFVSHPEGIVKPVEKSEGPPLTVMILILHYLVNANGAPVQGKWISFKELPDGAIYNEPFGRRAIKPMLNLFADKQEEFLRLAATLGGQQQKLGDVSVTITPFPRVPITFVIWGGDDEFPASGNILFDASAHCYLPTEDYAMMSGLIIYQLGELLPKSK